MHSIHFALPLALVALVSAFPQPLSFAGRSTPSAPAQAPHSSDCGPQGLTCSDTTEQYRLCTSSDWLDAPLGLWCQNNTLVPHIVGTPASPVTCGVDEFFICNGPQQFGYCNGTGDGNAGSVDFWLAVSNRSLCQDDEIVPDTSHTKGLHARDTECPFSATLRCFSAKFFASCSRGTMGAWQRVPAGTECKHDAIVPISKEKRVSTCSTNGALVCNGASKFGLCNFGTVGTWLDVSAGTQCRNGAIVGILASSAVGASPSTTSVAPVFSFSPTSGNVTVTSTSTMVAASSAPAQPTSTGDSSTRPGDKYTMYTGDGTTGWPTESDWLDFDSMWTANEVDLNISCTEFSQANNSPQESKNIKAAINATAASTGVDARFIMAVMMQESKGCVRAPTTNWGVRNPGLFQDHDGNGTCNDPKMGGVQNPCPMSQIQQMVEDGVAGTAAGAGLEQCITQAASTDISKYYKAARIYNSGSVAPSKDLGEGCCTHCYASDIANRLTGWVTAPTACTLDKAAT